MNKQSTNLIVAILTIVLGALLVIYKESILNIAITILGVGLIAWAVFDYLNKNVTPAIIKAVIGVIIIVLGWLITDIVLFIFAGLLLVYAIFELYELIKAKKKGWELFVQPLLYLVAAVLLLLKGFDWPFMIAGIALIIQGGISLFNLLRK